MKKIFSSVLIFSLLLVSVPPFNVAQAAPPESLTGTGAEFDPYWITSCEEWVYIADNPEDFFTEYNYYEIGSNLDCSADGNNVVWGDSVNPFAGRIDGNGFEFTYNINVDEASNLGLFGYVSQLEGEDYSFITRMNMAGNLTTTGLSQNVGSIVGYLGEGSQLTRSNSLVTINGQTGYNLGGLVGKMANNSFVYNTLYKGDIISSFDYVGGIVGATDDITEYFYYPGVFSSYSTGTLDAQSSMGGIIGYMHQGFQLFNNFSTIEIDETGSTYFGGIVAYVDFDTDFATDYSSAVTDSIKNNWYGEETTIATCIGFENEGVEMTNITNDCEQINTLTFTDFFYLPANSPFSTIQSDANGLDSWLDSEAGYDIWYFSETDYPQLYHIQDSPTVTFDLAGAGTELNPYIIEECEDLIQITDTLQTLAAHYSFMPSGAPQTVDCTGIGNDVMVRSNIGAFMGSFDGNGNTIVIEIESDFEDIGLFGLTKNASIFDLTVDGNVTSVDATEDAGGLIGDAKYSQIENVVSEVYVVSTTTDPETESADDVGGLIGDINGGIVTDSYAQGDVDSAAGNAGGFAGEASYTTITNSYATGDVVVTVDDDAGGFIGYVEYSELTDVYATGDVTGTEQVGGLLGSSENNILTRVYAEGTVLGGDGDSDDDIGGLIGYSEYTELVDSYATGNVTGYFYVGGLIGDARSDTVIQQSYATGNIEGEDRYIGGIVGRTESAVTIQESYATGDVISTTDEYVGGLVGRTSSQTKIFDSFSRGKVTGYSEVGGLVGSNNGLIFNSYSTGLVTATNEGEGNLGGLTGSSSSFSVYSYWDYETAGTEDGIGFPSTTSQMKDPLTFVTSDVVFEGITLEAEQSARYIKLEITEVRDPLNTACIEVCTQMAEFKLFNNGVELDLSEVTISTDSEDMPGGEEVDKLIDNDVTTKFLAGDFAVFEELVGSAVVYLDAGEGNTFTFDQYNWYTANDAYERDPVSWTLSVSNDDETYTTVDSQSDSVVTSDRYIKFQQQGAYWDFDNIWSIQADVNDGYPCLQDLFEGCDPIEIDFTEETPRRGGGGSGNRVAKADTTTSTYAEEVQQVLAERIITQDPENLTNKCEALVMMERVFGWSVPTATSSKYTDVPEWCVSVAAYGTERGIVEGRAADRLGMETPVTRDEVALMIYRELKLQNYEFKGTTEVNFTDMPLTPWAAEATLALAKEGIVKGFADGSFGGKKNILKQDLAIMLLRHKKTNNYKEVDNSSKI